MDQSKIEIKCYPSNYQETSLRVKIDFVDFQFERAEEINGPKKNVFVVMWMPQKCLKFGINKFYIAIDDRVQYEIYEFYLNRIMQIGQIAEIGKFDCIRIFYTE